MNGCIKKKKVFSLLDNNSKCINVGVGPLRRLVRAVCVLCCLPGMTVDARVKHEVKYLLLCNEQQR